VTSASVEITIPVLNEETSLERNLLKAWQNLQGNVERPERIRLVIADNGSSDRTEQIGQELQATHPWLRYVRLPLPGVGAALRHSWQSSRADIVGYMDLDLATDLRHVPEAIAAIEMQYDLCYASRLHPKSWVIGRKFHRTIVSHAFNTILKLYLGARFSDGMCGFKFLRRSVLPRLIARGAVSDNWFFSTEILLAAERLNLKIKELPVMWTDDPDSHVQLFKLTYRYLQSMHVFHARDRVALYESRQTRVSNQGSE
jgi:glycosyltransferase involved in cell wall biosynthesis